MNPEIWSPLRHLTVALVAAAAAASGAAYSGAAPPPVDDTVGQTSCVTPQTDEPRPVRSSIRPYVMK
jgi:hypothetical protein